MGLLRSGQSDISNADFIAALDAAADANEQLADWVRLAAEAHGAPNGREHELYFRTAARLARHYADTVRRQMALRCVEDA